MLYNVIIIMEIWHFSMALYGFSFDLNLGQLPPQLHKPVQVRLAFWHFQLSGNQIKSWSNEFIARVLGLRKVSFSKEPSDYFQAAIPIQ